MLSTFPEFAPLNLEDRDRYNQLISEYPPISDISFATLQIWWNLDNQLSVASLNGNIVINYHLPFDPTNSGLGLVGTHLINESIEAIFNYQHSQGHAAKLIHVPEFVVEKLTNKSDFTIEEEIDYNEYILDAKGLANLEGHEFGRLRRKVSRFLREVDDRHLEFKSIDVSTDVARNEIIETIKTWGKTSATNNDPEHVEHKAIQRSLEHAESLGIQNLGLYVDGKLYAIFLYQKLIDQNYYILRHLKVDYGIPFIFDYMTHLIATKAVEDNVEFMNMEMDLGIENIRYYKTGLRPVGFFRKYSISPIS